MSPIGYEHYCAELLKDYGWNTRVTKGSGDQGIDVIAKRDSMIAVIQCKKHSKPVGNKAVQEVFAGKTFEDADVAAVVSNSGYTNSAKTLANKNKILLLHHSELSDLVKIINSDSSYDFFISKYKGENR